LSSQKKVRSRRKSFIGRGGRQEKKYGLGKKEKGKSINARSQLLEKGGTTLEQGRDKTEGSGGSGCGKGVKEGGRNKSHKVGEHKKRVKRNKLNPA